MNRLFNSRYRFYILTGVGFVLWMLFFDANDLRSQARNWWKAQELEDEKAYFQERIEAVKAERKEVLGSQQLRIKYAREKYLMKKRNEDVYVLVDENGDPIEK
ncbi:septum formation initiator [Fibrivirga algicola]|uniref:Septum formation initiator family protein n=1 Tax=Fibrivirga algicola TaxID=2950420 RepID=A0ABX0QL79_9BACT|nr:septum formation initiator [Fibrivirga algicola]ARK11314.1 septum formation initiator [Fibrella sp. ES10-3-2-2]NID13190.1 septum formation initiator family protein [Fibrivirga algicola]